MNKLAYIFLFSIFLFSCDNVNQTSNRKKIASVKGIVLYEDELLSNIPTGLPEEDSISFINQYINNWIKDQLLLKKAEDLLPENHYCCLSTIFRKRMAERISRSLPNRNQL